MDERSKMFHADFVPNLYHEGSLEAMPETSYNIGNYLNSLTTHKIILPGPKEGVQSFPRFILRAYIGRERIAEEMLWGEEAACRGLCRQNWKNYQKGYSDKYRLKASLLDYKVPGYTGCTRQPSVGVVELIDPKVLTSTPGRYISQHIDTVQKYGIEPLKEMLPIYPEVQISKACRKRL